MPAAQRPNSDRSNTRADSASDQPNWYTKARSRAWVKDRSNLKDVPSVPLFVGTFFYTGLSPFASGTVGSAAAAILYYVFSGLQNPIVLFIACLVVLALGIWSAGVIEKISQIHDPGVVVIDEVLGQWVALLTWIYAGDWMYVVIAFLLFRVFDIVKLWPARLFEERKGGAGIMLDDAVAGIYANFGTHLLLIVFRHLAK